MRRGHDSRPRHGVDRCHSPESPAPESRLSPRSARSPRSPSRPAHLSPRSRLRRRHPAPAATPAPAAEGASPLATVPPSANAILGVGRTGVPGLEVIEASSGHAFMELPNGVPDATWEHLVTAAPDGASTVVRNLILDPGLPGHELRLDGDWRLPTVGADAVPGGRSADGSTIVLVEPRADAYASPDLADSLRRGSRADPAVGRAADAWPGSSSLPGGFDFDTLSPDGRTLYVIEHLDDRSGGAYQVRSVDLATGRMDDVPVANKSNVDETMAGHPITQLRRADGTVMTLYRGLEHPFIHSLNSTDKWAICIDLPATGADDEAAAMDWALTDPGPGATVYAVNASLGLVVDVDTNGLAVRRQGTIPGTTAVASSPRIVLAKFGHEAGGPVGRRAVVTPTGGTLVAGGRDGLVAIRTKDLSVAWQALRGQAIRGVALTTDGSTVYALLGSGRIVAIGTTDGSLLGEVPGSGFDRLVAVMGG